LSTAAARRRPRLRPVDRPGRRLRRSDAETIAAARLIDGTVGWILPDVQVVDLAPDALWDHTRGRCGGGGCSGWTPEQTVVVVLP
jgi:hypothetical protein